MIWFLILYGVIALILTPVWLWKGHREFYENRDRFINSKIEYGYNKETILTLVNENYNFDQYAGSMVFYFTFAIFWPISGAFRIILYIDDKFNNKIVHESNLLIDDIEGIKMVEREILHESPTKREVVNNAPTPNKHYVISSMGTGWVEDDTTNTVDVDTPTGHTNIFKTRPDPLIDSMNSAIDYLREKYRND